MKKLLTVFTTIFLFSIEANATLLVSVGNEEYNIETVTGIYRSHIEILRDQVWWGNSELAGKFSYAVGTQLGTPNIYSNYGPAFAFSEYTGVLADYVTVRAYAPRQDKAIEANAGGYTWTFAVATAVPPSPVPEPTAVLLFGSGLIGIVMARFRKKKA